MTNRWAEKPFGEVATLQRGFDLPVTRRTSGRFVVYAANGPVGCHDTPMIAGPGVITGRSGSIGKVHFSSEPFWPLNTALFVKDFHGNEPRWVYWLLQSMDLGRYHEGTGVPTLNRNIVHRVRIALPPIYEQRRIAALLDHADALRAKRQDALALLDSLNEAIFLDMSSSTIESVVTLDDIADVQGGLQVTRERMNNPITVPYLRVANVHRGRLQLADMKSMQVTKAELHRTRLAVDDLLVVEGHGNAGEIGRVARWTGAFEPCSHQNHLIRVRVDAGHANAVFVEKLLNSQEGRRSLLRAARTTSGLNTISVSDVRRIRLSLPSLGVQKRFADRLAVLDGVTGVQRRHLSELAGLFFSLQHRAFVGQL